MSDLSAKGDVMMRSRSIRFKDGKQIEGNELPRIRLHSAGCPAGKPRRTRRKAAVFRRRGTRVLPCAARTAALELELGDPQSLADHQRSRQGKQQRPRMQISRSGRPHAAV
jgi:hypothetical protein